MYVYAPCTHSDHRGQKRALDHLELELQMTVSHCVDAGNLTQAPRENSQGSLTAEPYLQPHAYSFDVAETAVEKVDPKGTEVAREAPAACGMH